VASRNGCSRTQAQRHLGARKPGHVAALSCVGGTTPRFEGLGRARSCEMRGPYRSPAQLIRKIGPSTNAETSLKLPKVLRCDSTVMSL
jgi:hypothetical protein